MMGNPETEQEGGFLSGYRPSSFSRSTQKQASSSSPKQRTPKSAASTNKETAKDEFSTAISWPIILAIIPTLGAFIAGSAEVWSDFIMILLILYYVYKWITVPWAYYDTARSRRVIHQYVTNNNNQAGLDSNKKRDKRKESVEEELRKHELIGLVWVVISPAVAGYTLQYSRYFLSNYDKYMSTFNVTVFVLAATLKPLIHVMALLRERTVFLQSEMVINESEIEVLQRKLECMEEELDGLRKAFATKRDLGQVANGINPSIQKLSNTIRQFEKKDISFRSWSEDNFSKMDKRVRELDQLLYYSMEQDQKKSAQKLLVTLMFLPINLTFWTASRMAGLLPIPRALLGFTVNKSPRPTSSYRPNSKHLTHPDVHTSADASSSMQSDTFFHHRHATTAKDPSELSYSEE